MDYPKHVPYADGYVTCRSAAEEKAVREGHAKIDVTKSAFFVNYKFAGFDLGSFVETASLPAEEAAEDPTEQAPQNEE